MDCERFYFRYFAICQDENVMKVGTDSMLLGAWAEPGNAKNILDIGTGTGVLSLMLAQKSKAKIDAIEPDIKAFELAKFNVNQSCWKNRINIFHSSLQDYKPASHPELVEGYDFIISNPPYYKPYLKYGNQLPSQERRKIRSHEGLALNELLEHSLRLLSAQGQCCFILPYGIMEDFIEMAGRKGLYLHKKLVIRSKPEENCIRTIALFSRDKKELVENEISIYNSDKSYSKEYLKLTEEFHAVTFASGI